MKASAGHGTALLLRRHCPARLDDVGVIAPEVEQAALRAGVDPRTAHDLRLVVEEACVNVARHGYAGRARPGELAVAVEVAQLGGRPAIRIELRDDGEPFDPLAAATPDTGAAAEARPVGGLGIHLIRSLTDRQQYTREARGNRLVLWKSYTPRTH